MLQTQSSSAFPGARDGHGRGLGWEKGDLLQESCTGAPDSAYLPYGWPKPSELCCPLLLERFGAVEEGLITDLNDPRAAKGKAVPTARAIPWHHRGRHPSSGAGPGFAGLPEPLRVGHHLPSLSCKRCYLFTSSLCACLASSPQRFIFRSCFAATVQAPFCSQDEAAPLELCRAAKDIYFSRETRKRLG